MKRSPWKITFLLCLGLFAVIQLVPSEKQNLEPAPPEKGIEHQLPISQNQLSLLKNACYDCHSDELRRPWYASIAPASWMIDQHISEGRKNLNFSRWADYSSGIQGKKIDEILEQLREGTMPPWNYALVHTAAHLSSGQKKSLIKYLENLKN